MKCLLATNLPISRRLLSLETTALACFSDLESDVSFQVLWHLMCHTQNGRQQAMCDATSLIWLVEDPELAFSNCV